MIVERRLRSRDVESMMSRDQRNALDPAWDAYGVIRDFLLRSGEHCYVQSLNLPVLVRHGGPATHDANPGRGLALVRTAPSCLGSSTPIARSASRTQTFLSNRSATVFLAAAPCLDECPRFARAPTTASDSAERS